MGKIIIFFVFFILLTLQAIAKPIGFGFHFGLATPNDQINNVYNSNTITFNNLLSNIVREAAKIGYFIGIDLNMPLTDNFTFLGGISLNRFPQTELKIFVPKPSVPDQQFDTVILKSIQNIVPLSVGVNWYLFKSYLSPYVTGSLSYFHIVNSIDIVKLDINELIATTKSNSRLGAGIGAGIDLNLELITLNFEARYNFVNLIGKEGDEPTKKYLTVGIGIIFGHR